MKDPTFLLIDDDQDDHEIFTAALGEIFPAARCFTQFDCPSAIEFLAYAESPVIDYLFMDWHMPLMEAEECIRQLKDANPSEKTEVFILTGSAPLLNPETAHELGVKKVLIKQGSIVLFAQQIRLALKEQARSLEAYKIAPFLL